MAPMLSSAGREVASYSDLQLDTTAKKKIESRNKDVKLLNI
jgi:hypothetical protein